MPARFRRGQASTAFLSTFARKAPACSRSGLRGRNTFGRRRIHPARRMRRPCDRSARPVVACITWDADGCNVCCPFAGIRRPADDAGQKARDSDAIAEAQCFGFRDCRKARACRRSRSFSWEIQRQNHECGKNVAPVLDADVRQESAQLAARLALWALHPLQNGRCTLPRRQAVSMRLSALEVVTIMSAVPNQDGNRRRGACGSDHGQDHEHALGGQAEIGEDYERGDAEKPGNERLH